MKCETILYDFAEISSEDGWKKLEAQLRAKLDGKDVAVLVNNVAEFQHELLISASWSYVTRASAVNSHSYAAMCRHFKPSV